MREAVRKKGLNRAAALVVDVDLKLKITGPLEVVVVQPADVTILPPSARCDLVETDEPFSSEE